MKCSSYGSSVVSSNNLKIKLDISVDVKDRHVLMVEDIVDSGYTIKCVE